MKTIDEYKALLAANHEMMTPEEFENFLIDELLERMRVNVGLITENVELKRKLDTASKNVQVELLKYQAEVVKDFDKLEDETKMLMINSQSKGIAGSIGIVVRMLSQ